MIKRRGMWVPGWGSGVVSSATANPPTIDAFAIDTAESGSEGSSMSVDITVTADCDFIYATSIIRQVGANPILNSFTLEGNTMTQAVTSNSATGMGSDNFDVLMNSRYRASPGAGTHTVTVSYDITPDKWVIYVWGIKNSTGLGSVAFNEDATAPITSSLAMSLSSLTNPSLILISGFIGDSGSDTETMGCSLSGFATGSSGAADLSGKFTYLFGSKANTSSSASYNMTLASGSNIDYICAHAVEFK